MSFEDHPGRSTAGWIAAIVGIIVVLAVIIGGLGFLLNWFNTDKEVFEPANVKAQYHAVLEDWQSMERQAEIVCEIKVTKGGRSGPTFLEDPAQANAAIYRKTQIDYNRRQQNFFESEQVGPKGYPSEAPSLAQMEEKVC